MNLPKARTVLAVVSVIGYIAITAAFFVVLFYGGKVGLPDGDLGKQIVGMLGLVVGTWNAEFLMIITYHYGSSEGSTAKSIIIEKKLLEKETV